MDFFCIRHPKNISTEELAGDNEVAFVCSLGNMSQRARQNDRKTLSACLKNYQVKRGSGHIGNNELSSLQFRKNMIWRENWKGLHKRDNSFTLKCSNIKCLNETIKTVHMKMTAVLNPL